MKSRNFSVTIFEESWEIPSALPSGLTYLCGQKEKCESTGRIHWQLFCRTVNPVRFGSVKKYLNCDSAHIEIAKNTTAARSYCFKTETRYDNPFELGIWNDVGRPKNKTTDDDELRKELYRRISEIRSKDLKIFFREYIPEPKLYYKPTTPVCYRWCSIHEDMDECWNKLNDDESLVSL